MDGYVNAGAQDHAFDEKDMVHENYKKFNYIKELYSNQIEIDKEIESLSGQIGGMPSMPTNMDKWVSSFRSNFKISDFSKLFKINKRYRHLMEERNSNGNKIKIFAIDNILDQIDETLNKK